MFNLFRRKPSVPDAEELRYRLLKFMAKSSKVTGSGEYSPMKDLVERGWVEAAPYDKDGMLGDGWQITLAGRIALRQHELQGSTDQ